MRFVNLMDNPVRVMRNAEVEDGSYTSFRSMAQQYGVDLENGLGDVEATGVSVVDNVTVYETFGSLGANLPAPEPDTMFIVPVQVAQACQNRKDLLYPIVEIPVGQNGGIVYKALARYNVR